MTWPVALAYAIEGPQEAPVVVLAHAIGTSRAMWGQQIPILAADWRVITVDLRGHGASPVPLGPYRMDDLGGDLIALLDRLGVERASICGLSLGGMAALEAAVLAPGRVDRLVVLGVVTHPASPTAWLDRAHAVRAGGTAAIADLVIERWGYLDREPDIQRVIREMLLATDAEGYASCCEAIAAMDLRADLGHVSAPTLVLTGSHDPAAPPSTASEVAGLLRDASVGIVDGAAHLANVEQPRAVTEAIVRHLRG